MEVNETEKSEPWYSIRLTIDTRSFVLIFPAKIPGVITTNLP